MATVLHRTPVVALHPLVPDTYVTLARGVEFADDDPVVKAYAWAFEEDDTPASLDAVVVPAAKKSTRKA